VAGIANPPADQHIATGCELCDFTGYKGRVGIYELLLLDDAIRSAVRTTGRTDEIRSLARGNGMKLMQDYALDLVRSGATTLDEVHRVVPFEQVRSSYCSACHRELSPVFSFCPYCGEKVAGVDAAKSSHKVFVEQGAGRE
jgi:type IV pilus assembly protein PilB